MIPLDAIALPESDAVIGIRLERETPPVVGARLAGIKVLFEAVSDGKARGGGLAGSAVTGASGLATFTLKAPATPGLFRYRAALEDPRSIPLEKAGEEVLLDVLPAKSRLLVVLPQSLMSQAIPAARDGGNPEPEFQVALRDLGKDHVILYLATQNGYAPSRLRPWLESQGLPQGPVFLALSEGDWPKLSSFVSSLALSRWQGEHWGVASERSDALALERAGLRVVLLEAAGGTPSVGKIHSASSWAEAKKLIEGKS